MSSNTHAGLSHELSEAIRQVNAALQRAAAASADLEALLPRIEAMGALFEELESTIQRGRTQLGAPAEPAAFARPTLVVPPPEPRAPQWTPAPPRATPIVDEEPAAPASAETASWDQSAEHTATGGDAGNGAAAEHRAGTTSFRLEFQSRPGPLDLRAVDEAISEHPAVRDVALLDYDGRKATLKVWIEAGASAADVQQSLYARAGELFAGNEISVIALEDVA